MFEELINIEKKKSLSADTEIINILLKDNISVKNIICATTYYEANGK